MERGKLGIDDRQLTVFVFENLIAKSQHYRTERTALRLHQWEFAIDTWTFDIHVLDYMQRLINYYNQPVEVITSRPKGFADVLHDRLWSYEVFVDATMSGPYQLFSHRYAIDPMIKIVYDPDPHHRFGYGFRAREWDPGVYA